MKLEDNEEHNFDEPNEVLDNYKEYETTEEGIDPTLGQKLFLFIIISSVSCLFTNTHHIFIHYTDTFETYSLRLQRGCVCGGGVLLHFINSLNITLKLMEDKIPNCSLT